MTPPNALSRRRFLQASAIGAVGSATTSTARAIGANDRIRLGIIGCGRQATHHLENLLKLREPQNLAITAVCDVYDKAAARFAERSGADAIKDYRKLLDRKDVDYVLVATPEHWHARQVLDALDAGKHVYCEKPMTHTIDEAKAVRAKVKSSGLKFLLGVQGMSDDSYEAARKLIREGALGKLVQAQIDYPRNYDGDFWVTPPDPDLKPGVNFDWEMWLGPAPRRPFDVDRCFSWRRYWDYSGGVATDLLVHRVTRLLKATEATLPVLVVGTGGKHVFDKSPAEVPDTFNMLLEYPENLGMFASSCMANDTEIPHVIRGHEATLEFNNQGFVVRPQNLGRPRHGRRREGPDAANARPNGEITHKKTGAEDVGLHHKNLHAAIRENAELKCDVELAFRATVATALAIESYRAKRTFTWDAASETGRPI